MAHLRELAQQVLREVERPLEQDVEQVERTGSVFQGDASAGIVVEHCFSENTAKNEACSTVPASGEWNGGTLPEDIARWVSKLRKMPCPSRVDPGHWRAAVRDCQWLCIEGWAEQALALGWTPLDLFGAVTDRRDDPAGDGLAVKLAGRKLLAISEGFATVENGPHGRAYLHRSNDPGARLLWELGRGR
jgi:hypothetical protein